MLQVVQQPALRGAEVFASQLSDALAERGHESRTLYLYALSGPQLALRRGDAVLAADSGHPLERLAVQPSVLRQIGRLVRGFRPDVIQLNGARTVKYGAALRHIERGARWVTVYRNIGDPTYWIRGPLKRLAYRHVVFSGVDGIVSLSERASAAFRDVFGVRQPVEVIPTGVSAKALMPREPRSAVRNRLGIPDDAKVVLYVGSLSKEKRPDRLVDAFAMLAGAVPAARLLVVGHGPERSAAGRQAQHLGLEGKVYFAGVTNDVASYYAAADLFALTSDTEGIPGALLEASYSGLPVVATNVGLVSDCVVDGETGFLVEPDAAAFAASMIRAFRDDESRLWLGEQGRRFVTERFLMSSVASRYEGFYERLLRSRRS